MCAKIAYGFWKNRITVSSVCSLSCEKGVTGCQSSSINPSVKRQKQCVYPRILLLWQKVCVKYHQHQFSVVLNTWTFRSPHWDEFCIKTLVWRHTKFNRFKSWSQLIIQYGRSTYRRCRIWQKTIIFSDEAHFDLDGYVNNQIVAFRAEKTRMHTLKRRRTQNESLFGADFSPDA